MRKFLKWSFKVTKASAQLKAHFNFRWFREEKDQLKAIIATQRMKLGPPGLLQIQHAQIVDQGKYICVVNNSQGEERVQISLIVTSK